VGETNGKVMWVLLAASAATATLASILMIITINTPILVFRGPIEGYIALSNYRIEYFGEEFRSVFLDRVSQASIALYIPITLGLSSSMHVILHRRRPGLTLGLLAGSSLSLQPGLSLLRGLLGLADDYASNNLKISATISTTAGTIHYQGQHIEAGFGMALATSPVLQLLVAVSIALSVVALIIHEVGLGALLGMSSRVTRGMTKERALTLVILALIPTISSLQAMVVTYYPVKVNIAPTPPPGTLQNPLYMYTCSQIQRSSRAAIIYTDFETYPVPGFIPNGGMWSLAQGQGYKGNALQGIDNHGGVGGASQYYYSASVSIYTSLWASVKVRLASGVESYRGLAFLRQQLNRLYEVSIYSGFLYIRDYGVTAANTWTIDASSPISGYSAGSWYTIVASYTVSGNTVSIQAWAYDVNGNLVASTSATITGPRVFTPAYIGAEVNNPFLSSVVYYDDFVVSTTDPRVVSFSGLQSGMAIEIVDNLGNPVTSGTATSSTLNLSVVRDIVVGTGSGGTIRARYPDGSQCILYVVPASDAIVGGDEYALSVPAMSVNLGPAGTSASVTAYISPSSSAIMGFNALRIYPYQGLQARLIIASITAPTTLYATITLSSITTSSSIVITAGNPSSSSTGYVPITANNLAYVNASGYFTAPAQTATVNLYLELCTLPSSQGACTYYPVILTLKS